MAKVLRHTLNQRVYQNLREMIVSGHLPQGAQLDEATLSSELDVSRTPIREAVAQLVKEGLVENRPYRGNYVRTFTAKQVDDLYTVRKALEALAVRTVVPRLSPRDLEAIRAILVEVQAALDRGDMAAYSEADARFHHTMIRLTENETLIEVLRRLSSQIQMVRTVANQDAEVVERTAQERPRILAALEARDAERAAELMEQHIDGVRRAVVAQLEGQEKVALGTATATAPSLVPSTR